MAVNNFDSHLTDVGNNLEEFKGVLKDMYELLLRHNNNAYSTLISTDFDNRAVTKAQYDAAMVSINDLLNTWLPAGHGTNIDGYLFEVP